MSFAIKRLFCKNEFENEVVVFIERPVHVLNVIFWDVQPTILIDLIKTREEDELQTCLWFAPFEVMSLCGRRGSAAGRR